MLLICLKLLFIYKDNPLVLDDMFYGQNPYATYEKIMLSDHMSKGQCGSKCWRTGGAQQKHHVAYMAHHCVRLSRKSSKNHYVNYFWLEMTHKSAKSNLLGL